ncbi:MAG: PEP/pyruvate-binding domain-containing protein [Bacteroidia bacterium]
MTYKYIYCLVFLFIINSGCYKQALSDNSSTTTETPYVNEIKNNEELKTLAGKPLSSKFSSVLSVKIVYELASKRLYFINSKKYVFHYGFCNEVLGYQNDLVTFNSNNYQDNVKQEYYLSCLNYYAQSGIYALEFTSNTSIKPEQIRTLYNEVASRSYIKDSLRLLINSDYINDLFTEGKITVPTISPDAIYKEQSFQSLYTGATVGRLRMVSNLNSNIKLNSNDIVIIKGTPVQLPNCKAIISDAIQTPLSHINILCRNRGIPAAAYTRVWNDSRFLSLKDKMVSLVITNDSIIIREANEKEKAKLLKTSTLGEDITLLADLNIKTILPLHSIKEHHYGAIGNKSIGMSILYQIQQKNKTLFEVPEGGFAIPFYFYNNHIEKKPVAQLIYNLLHAQVYKENRDSIKAQLKRIRKAITKEPLDKQLLAAVTTRIEQNNIGMSYRFRSSSNAEDMFGFSGAGLYTSKTGIVDNTQKTIEKAIKKVWASAWNEAAFFERENYNISHTNMMMGVLVHRNFPDEILNGVAITRNLYRNNYPGFTINAQKGNISVVSPPDSIVCEQLICMNSRSVQPSTDNVTVEYITFSNLNKNRTLFTKEQVTQLYNALSVIEEYYYFSIDSHGAYGLEEFALDIEFKFDSNKKLYIKQARPFY